MFAAHLRQLLGFSALWAWLLFAPLASAQVTVQSMVSPGVLKLGQTAKWTITASATGQLELLPPEPVDGLRYGRLLGPDQAQRISIFNGRRTVESESTWSLEVTPERVGEFSLPEPRVRFGGQIYKGEARGFEVSADLKGADLGLLKIEGAPARLVEGQPVVLQLVFGWRASAGRGINHAGLFLPWWDGVPGAFLEVAEVEADRDRVEIQINRRQRVIVERLADYQHAGQPYIAFRLPVLLTPTRPGSIELAGSFLEFGEVITERNFFGSSGRLVEPFFAPAETLAIEVRPLPKEGQPLDFGGAIGSFELSQTAGSRDLKVGDTVKLVVEVRGQGNLPFFTIPEPDVDGAFRGFQYYGFKEDKRLDRRRIEYDLVPLDTQLKSLPPIELPYFDPVDWQYKRLSAEPIPIRVRALANAAPLEGDSAPVFADDIEDIRSAGLEPAGGEAQAPDEGLLASVALGLGVGWLALRSAVRQGGREPGALLDRRRRRSLSDLQRALGTSLDPESDLQAWANFLGARSGEPASAWIGRDLEAWSAARTASGRRPLSPASLESLRRIGRGLESASYSGATKRFSKGDLIETARELMEDGL